MQTYIENILHIPFSIVMQTDSYAILLSLFNGMINFGEAKHSMCVLLYTHYQE